MENRGLMTTQQKVQKKRPAPCDKAVTGKPRSPASIPDFDLLPDGAMVRLAQLVRDPKHPSRPVPLPFSAASIWRKVAAGSFPQPVKLGVRTTAWRVSDVRAWLVAQAGKEA